MVQHAPVFGKEPSEKKQFGLPMTMNISMFQPSYLIQKQIKIMSTSKMRDETSAGNDWFSTIIFDSFNDKENGLAFATTPAGLRTDFTILKMGSFRCLKCRSI